MEFLLLGGMILLMSLFRKVPAMKDAYKALGALQIPIGIVVFFVGLELLIGRAYPPPKVFGGVMGLIAGVILLFNLFRLIPKAKESMEKVSTVLATFEIPVGIITIIAALIAMLGGR